MVIEGIIRSMYIRIRETIIIGVIISMIGLIGEIERINILEGKNIGISIIIIILYNIINKWIKSGNKEIEIILIINLIGLFLFINNNKEIGIIYIILELYTMTIYILIYYNKSSNINKEGENNILYFFINSISSIILLLIIGIIYYNYGIINIKDYIYINNSFLFYLFIIIILFKLGIYPFNNWIIRTYKGFDIKILLLQSFFSKFIYLYLFISLPLYEESYIYIIIISIINLIYISILGINSYKLKEILIISSIFNLSFLLFASFSPFLFTYYFILYIINTYLIFFYLSSNLKFHSFYNSLSINIIEIKRGGNPIYIIIILIFSLIGFPPLGGFFIKLFIIFNSFNLSILISYPFIFIIIITTLLSAIFYLKIINYFFNNNPISLIKQTYTSSANIIASFGEIELYYIIEEILYKDYLIMISFFTLFITFFYFFHPYYFYFLYFML